ncbi:MAG TPA: hypothetical protein PKJ37_08465, partial [Acidobacteriota bacterium]|nr:hypothetical protein [Acidobacteriota bacterium]HNT17908.1 hypothetical protein [Acidobacteriota bacterium]
LLSLILMAISTHEKEHTRSQRTQSIKEKVKEKPSSGADEESISKQRPEILRFLSKRRSFEALRPRSMLFATSAVRSVFR